MSLKLLHVVCEPWLNASTGSDTTGIEAIKVLENFGITYHSIAEADWDDAANAGIVPSRSPWNLQRGDQLYRSSYCTKRYADAGWENDWPMPPLDSAAVYGAHAEGYTDNSVHGG